jgi:negative regulator of flagellin synthesis FlgM
MYIYGMTHIHSAQPIHGPHRAGPPTPAASSPATGVPDQVDISPLADLVAQARDLPEIRADRVAAIRAQIAAGTYETADKLQVAVDRLLDELA